MLEELITILLASLGPVIVALVGWVVGIIHKRTSLKVSAERQRQLTDLVQRAVEWAIYHYAHKNVAADYLTQRAIEYVEAGQPKLVAAIEPDEVKRFTQLHRRIEPLIAKALPKLAHAVDRVL